MADLHTLLERMRRDLAAVEAGITASPPPVAVAWLEIDSGGIVRDVTATALERLGLEMPRESMRFKEKVQAFIRNHPEEWATQFGPLTREELELLEDLEGEKS